MTPVTDSELSSESLIKKSVDALVTLQPLIIFLNRAIGDGTQE